jgi:hypothetical protein
VRIGEREMWWRVEPVGDTQASACQANLDWLVARRKYVYNLAEGNIAGETPGWDVSNRAERYDNLQVATQYGSAYEEWKKGHNDKTGEPVEATEAEGREAALAWMAGHRGITENPSGSNTDNRSDGIRKAQIDCAAGGSWLIGTPWCGEWCFNALQAAGVEGIDYNLASVAWVESQARAGKAPFTGWTTDGDHAEPGDLVVLFGGDHVAMVREVHSDYVLTEEGNTSSGSGGSQSNGGGSYQRQRSRSSDTHGYAKVRYP